MPLRASLAVLLLGLAGAAPPVDESKLFQDRVRWWATSDHALDVGGMGPLETVRGTKPSSLRTADPARRTVSAAALAAAIAYVEPMHTQSLLIWQGGALQLEWYGQGFDANSVSSPASMMKPVMAMSVGVAIKQGHIRSVDDPVERYLPEWRGQARGKVTLRQLLQMASGLKKDAAAAAGGGRGEQLMLGTHIEKVLLETELAAAPGSEFDYNNAVSGLIGLILQRATHRRYADWLSDSIWRPMGATDAQVWLDRPGGLARSYCCLVTNARNWLRAGLLVKDRGRANGRQVVPAAWIDEMTAPSPKNPNFGYQIWRATPFAARRGYGSGPGLTMITEKPFLAEDMVYFDGAIGERVYVSRKYDLVIVRIGSSAPKWDDSRLPNIVVSGLKLATPAP